MNLQTYDIPVVVGSGTGTKTGICWFVSQAPGDLGTLPDHTGYEGWPEPLRDLNAWAGSSVFAQKADGNPYDSETTYSPNPDGGDSGPDTVKGIGLMFKPSGEMGARAAVSAYLRIENLLNSTTHTFYPDDPAIPDTDPWYTLPCFAITGYKTPDPQLWDVGQQTTVSGGQKHPFPPNAYRSGPSPLRVDGALTQWESLDISSIYNELLHQNGFVFGTSHMLLGLYGIPWYGGSIPLYPKPLTAVLRVTVDLDSAVGDFDFPSVSAAPQVTPPTLSIPARINMPQVSVVPQVSAPDLVGMSSSLRYYNGSAWVGGALLKKHNGAGWETIPDTMLK